MIFSRLIERWRRGPPLTAQLENRATGDESAPLHAFAIKKSGTHLLRNVLERLGMTCIDQLDYHPAAASGGNIVRPNAIILSHRLPSPQMRGLCQRGRAKIIMNLRDPRGIFLSMIDFFDWKLPLSSSGWWPVEFRRHSYKQAFTSREELGLALLDDEFLDDDPFTPWLNLRRSRTLFHHPGVLKIRYEDFFHAGVSGGAGASNPVTHICRYLCVPEPNDAEALLASAKAGPSATRNVGVPDRWRTRLSPSLLDAFMARHGDLVREFGYPER